MIKLFHETITDFARLFPEKPALADAQGEKSYRELETESLCAACMLSRLGLRKGDTAAVYVPYTKDILTGAIAVLRAGGIFLPLDYAYPLERLHFILKDSCAKAILTVRSLWESKKLDFPGERVIFLDELPRENSSAAPCGALDEDSPAMLLYTSGTTGNPKGVVHSHSMLLHLVDWMNTCDGAAMNGDTRAGVMSNFSFVGSQMFLLGPLSKGGTVCIAPENARKDLSALDQFLREEKITHIFLPSGLAAILAEDYDISGRNVFAAGEKLRNFSPRTSGTFLINSYGSTELSGVMAKKIYGDEEVISVGKPRDNAIVCLVDERLRLSPPGEAGELLVSSPYMSRQYVHLPKLSAEKWILIDGTVWFRTGDRAVCTASGDYVILGRTDNMVKLRGFRIETGEVETQIARAAARLGRSDVGELAVVVKTVNGTEHLCCYYEAKKELDRKAITQEVSQYLAEYMVPDLWLMLGSFPRNANGKILRRELPQPRSRHASSGVLDNEVISRMVLTAADLLEPDGFIGPDDRFTDLGGTSLNAMQYAVRLREQGIRISGAEVLRLNVLRKIAEAAEVSYEQLWSPEEYEAVRRDFAARGEHIRKVLPLSPRQDEMLFMQILHPDQVNFQKTWFLQLDSPVSESQLQRALNLAAEDCEPLRAAVVFHDVSVIQQVITDRKIPLRMIEAPSFGSREMASLRRRISDVPAEPQRDSTVRAYGIHAGERNFLCVTARSIIVDDQLLRGFLAKVMEVLGEVYPEDVSIRDWHAILEMGLESDAGDRPKTGKVPEKASHPSGARPALYVYSENKNPKLVFVHTGNTGSEAYYHLADRLREAVSFAVIEPWNLYCADRAVYGIRNIAKNYIRILKQWQPEGPYFLGGWCYGGVVAQEMACQLEEAGEEVRHLFMLDSHALDSEQLRSMSKSMFSQINRHYFETCPLFSELRANGMLDAMVLNAAHVAEDMGRHTPSVFHGKVTYFKPDQLPAGISGETARYWQKMMDFEAGNYERYFCREKLRVIHTPHEHDLMMDDPSLDIIVPAVLEAISEKDI